MTSLAPQPAVVLVHGAYANASSWSEVIERLQRAGLTATATTVEIDSGHLSLITHPHEVTQLILSAARAVSQ